MSASGKKTALVTGASQGIGESLAIELNKAGLRVFATARNIAKLEHLTALGIETLALDVSSTESIEAAVHQVKALTGGSLDLLINNAGLGGFSMVTDIDMASARTIFDTNVLGLIDVTRLFAPLLAASTRGPRLVNIGSVASRVPSPGHSLYDASKAAVRSLSATMRQELAPLGITVIHVYGGGVATKFYDTAASTQAYTLPQNSLYAAARGLLEPILSGAKIKSNIATPGTHVSADEFAKSVVFNALSIKPKPNQWKGSDSFMCWLMSTFGWDTLPEWVMIRQLGLQNLGKALKAKNA